MIEFTCISVAKWTLIPLRRRRRRYLLDVNKFYDCYFHNRISTTSPNPTSNPSSFLHHPFPFSNPLHLLCLSPSIHIHIHIQSTPKSIYPIDKKSTSIHLRLRSKTTYIASIHVIYMSQHVIALNIQPSILPPSDHLISQTIYVPSSMHIPNTVSPNPNHN